MLKPHLSYIAAISVHRRTSGYPWRGGSVRSDFQCRLLYLKTYGGSREVAEDDRSLLNSWRWSLGRSKWGVKCSDPNSRISVFWTTLTSMALCTVHMQVVCPHWTEITTQSMWQRFYCWCLWCTHCSVATPTHWMCSPARIHDTCRLPEQGMSWKVCLPVNDYCRLGDDYEWEEV